MLRRVKDVFIKRQSKVGVETPVQNQNAEKLVISLSDLDQVLFSDDEGRVFRMETQGRPDQFWLKEV